MALTNNKETMPIFYEENSIIAFPNNSQFYQPNSACFTPHWHDWMEILYVFHGSLSVHVNQKTFDATEGDIILFFPGQLHFATAGAEGARYRVVMFDPAAFYNHTRSSKKYLSSMFEHKDSYANLTNHPNISQNINELLECYTDSGNLVAHPLLLISILYRLLAAIQSNCMVNESKSNTTNSSIITVLQYVNEHLTEPLSTEMLSNLLGYETSYFIRLFKKSVGMTPKAYIRSIRLEKAEKALATTDTPINAIAHNCGFENMSYFTRAFQEVYHTTPSAYRSESKKKSTPYESRLYL